MDSGRRRVPELMDDPDVDRGELDRSLKFIRAVNRRLGGAGAALRWVKRWTAHWPAERPIRIIDIGTGSADIPLALARWADASGRKIRITAVDLHPTTLALAAEHIGERSDITLLQADATSLMDHFAVGDFDIAHAGMFIHHLSDVQAMTVLRIMDQLTEVGLIWNDLLRGAMGRLGVRILTSLAPPMVRHDARVSIDAGFTRAEALDLAARVELTNVVFKTHLGYRFTLVSRE